jgi:hypothetical protein
MKQVKTTIRRTLPQTNGQRFDDAAVVLAVLL